MWTYGNGLSELGGVLETASLLEDAGGRAGLDCLQSRSLSAQGGGKDTTRDHAELGYRQNEEERVIAPEVSRGASMQTEAGAEQPIGGRRVPLDLRKPCQETEDDTHFCSRLLQLSYRPSPLNSP